jgi:hypothetical protein
VTPSPFPNNRPNHSQSIFLFRWIGYALLLFALLDLIVVLVPLNLMNPEWEFQAMGAIIERIPVPLIGVGLIFFGESSLRKREELVFLKLLSWLCLLFGLACLVVIPAILATSAVRLTNDLDTNFGNQLSAQIEQTVTAEEQLSQATSEEITEFLESRGSSLEGKTPAQAKQELIAGLSTIRQEASNKVQGELSKRHLSLKKNTAKWIIGSEISAFVFIYTWWLTRWARATAKGMWPGKKVGKSPISR